MRSANLKRPALACLVLAAGTAAAAPLPPRPQEGSRADEKKAEPLPPRLRLEVERQVTKVLEQHERAGTPHFETSVEVVARSPQAMLGRFFGGFDLECGPAAGGAPTEVETRAFRPTPAPYVDFLAAAKALVGRLRGKGPDRYYLYQARRGQELSYFAREGRLSDALFYNTPGTRYELVEAFPDAETATQALRRLERGFATAPSPSASPPPPWVSYPCRPRKD